MLVPNEIAVTIGTDVCYGILGELGGGSELATSLADYGVLGSMVSSPSRVRGGASAADKFSKSWSFQNAYPDTYKQL